MVPVIQDADGTLLVKAAAPDISAGSGLLTKIAQATGLNEFLDSIDLKMVSAPVLVSEDLQSDEDWLGMSYLS